MATNEEALRGEFGDPDPEARRRARLAAGQKAIDGGGDGTKAWQDQENALRNPGQSGDYSDEGAEAGERYREWERLGGQGVPNEAGTFFNPGSADYGGRGGVDFYRNEAIAGGKQNDAARAANEAAMRNSFANMTKDRGQVAPENAALAGRAAATREQQLQALNLSRDAAMGRAPSEADFQTRIGMNDVMAQRTGTMGSARGLSALSGAQSIGSAISGQSASNLGMVGGLARSKEIQDAIGMYGTQAGTVRDQDLSRLHQNSQNSIFNAKQNDAWKIGNAELLAKQGQLGTAQAGTDQAWMEEKYRGTNKQFEMDQRMAAIEAGADADKAASRIAADREAKENRRQLVNGGVTVGLTAAGTVAGGPVGGAGGAAAGGAFAASNKDWDW